MTRNEDLVRAVEASYDAAWCAGDVEGLLKCLSPDAVLVNPRGQVAVGHEAIRKALGGFLFGEAAGSLHRSSLNRIAFLREDVAIVDGHAVITLRGVQDPLEHPFTDVLVRDEDDRWLIAHVRAYHFEAEA